MLPPNSFGRDSRADFPSGRFRLVITEPGLKYNNQRRSQGQNISDKTWWSLYVAVQLWCLSRLWGSLKSGFRLKRLEQNVIGEATALVQNCAKYEVSLHTKELYFTDETQTSVFPAVFQTHLNSNSNAIHTIFLYQCDAKARNILSEFEKMW